MVLLEIPAFVAQWFPQKYRNCPPLIKVHLPGQSIHLIAAFSTWNSSGVPDDLELCLPAKLHLCATWYLLRYFSLECSPAWKVFLNKMCLSVLAIKIKIAGRNGTDGSILMACSSANGASQSLQPVSQAHSYLYYKCFFSFDGLWKWATLDT